MDPKAITNQEGTKHFLAAPKVVSFLQLAAEKNTIFVADYAPASLIAPPDFQTFRRPC